VLFLAGSRNMLGASALCGLAAMRGGAGLATLAVPKSLNGILQKKISPVIMTLPLDETKAQTFSVSAFSAVKKTAQKYQALGIGPGLTRNPATQRLVYKLVEKIPLPMLIDADALNALSENPKPLNRSAAARIITPHPGEFSRLTKKSVKTIEQDRKGLALAFAKQHNCIVVLKGPQTVVASPKGKTYINKTGNAGMATAGSGDVLTGILTAFLGQGIEAFKAAKAGVYLHGLAGDLAAKAKGKASMIATDIIDQIPRAIAACRAGGAGTS